MAKLIILFLNKKGGGAVILALDVEVSGVFYEYVLGVFA